MVICVLTGSRHPRMQIRMTWFRSHLNSFWMRGSQSSKASRLCSSPVSTMQPWAKHTRRPGSIICTCSSQLRATNLACSPSMSATDLWMDSALRSRMWSQSSIRLSLYLSIKLSLLNRIINLLQMNLESKIKRRGHLIQHSKTTQQ